MDKLNQDLKLMRLVLYGCVNIIEDGGSDIIRILENGKNTYLISAMDTLAAGIYWMCKQVNEILKEAEKESA